jgi:3-methyladenine DNA glycosylase AlkC
MANLLKNMYNLKYLEILSNNIKLNYNKFEKDKFLTQVFDENWENRALKQRMRHISKTLNSFLPKNYSLAIEILKNTFKQISTDFGFQNMIFQDYVELFGLEFFDQSMEALELFTINSSSEFAIRQFILKYPEKTMNKMELWAKNKNFHVRRLASEGCRPALPWAIALTNFKNNPASILKILDILKDDNVLYVRKSVANNLNDISKNNPAIVIEIAKKWINQNQNRDWIIKHGCRTLLKKGNREIFELLGFKKNNDVKLKNILISPVVFMGEKLEFSFLLQSKTKLGKLRIEFAVDFLRKNNSYSKKVFKISEGIYNQKSKQIKKYYSFKHISTRKYYRGKHKLTLILNGIEIIEKEFFLN